MLRSLYSAVSGLNAHQMDMDVVGNNISNVNTTAYKSQNMSFSDLLYQTTGSATAATATKTGTNAVQVGLGAMTGAISTNITTQGAAETTNYPFDMMISGNSFFVVNDGTNQYYTRDGSFKVDGAGDLVNGQGMYVQGWSSGDGSTVNTKGAVGKLTLQSTALQTIAGERTTDALIGGNIDANDSDINSDSGKNLKLEIYGSDGKKYNLTFNLKSTDTEGSYTFTLNGITDADGKTVTPEANEDITLKFDNTTGKFVSAASNTNGLVTINLPNELGGGIQLDFSTATNYASTTSGNSTIKAATGNVTGDGTGRAAGTMSGITVSKNGMINATYSNGASRLIGQVATAQFANASGLEKTGENLYAASSNSGNAMLMDVTADGGTISTGVLEASNVDLSNEFTRMIMAQRGFQANSRVITTSDTMLQELKQLKK